ncbi:MAG TPA: VWA domain-containing protein [Pyrinomonadaceae bacterium]|nr:VWA domain-containing protein [Pyrinomonadaceae bacterium]
MKHHQYPTLLLTLSTFALIVVAAFLFSSANSVSSQTPNKNSNANSGRPSRKAIQLPTPTPESGEDVVKIDADLVKIDALVMQKNTARIVGDLKVEDFLLYEDGTKQEITHFSKDSLPLSVMLLIDRGGCLDPYSDDVHRAAREAIDRLKLVDEIAVMAYHTKSDLILPFTTSRILIEDALTRIPPQTEMGGHCLNALFSYAANYMMRASNPAGRRVIIVISGLTRSFDCPDSPTGKSAALSIYESGSVVCGIIPKGAKQAFENGQMTMLTRVFKVGGVDYMDIQSLANETGGEVLSDEPKKLETTFQTLIDHLRSRYNLAFVSTNKKRDGATRKLRLDLTPTIQRSKGKLVVKARRSYIAPRK